MNSNVVTRQLTTNNYLPSATTTNTTSTYIPKVYTSGAPMISHQQPIFGTRMSSVQHPVVQTRAIAGKHLLQELKG